MLSDVASYPHSRRNRLKWSVYPWVAMMRSAPVSFTACSRSSQSAWSLSTKPRSRLPRRRQPRNCIQPLTMAVLKGRIRRVHGVPMAEPGVMTSAFFSSSFGVSGVTCFTSGNWRPACASASFMLATAPCT